MADYPLIGIGPGRLGTELDSRGFAGNTSDTGAAAFVANNIWIQAMLDGGLVALTMQTILVGIAAFGFREAPGPLAFAILVAWMTIVLGAGLTVSNFWDSESWVLIGSFFALTSITRHAAPVRARTLYDRVEATSEVTSTSSRSRRLPSATNGPHDRFPTELA